MSYKCPFCSQTFVMRANMESHLRFSHSDRFRSSSEVRRLSHQSEVTTTDYVSNSSGPDLLDTIIAAELIADSSSSNTDYSSSCDTSSSFDTGGSCGFDN